MDLSDYSPELQAVAALLERQPRPVDFLEQLEALEAQVPAREELELGELLEADMIANDEFWHSDP